MSNCWKIPCIILWYFVQKRIKNTRKHAGSEEKKELERNPDFRPCRWVVEVTHSFFNRFRKLLVRYEKKASNKEEKPDLTLVLAKMNGYCQGHACLTMETAYSNARLTAKPDSSWLVP